MSILSRQIVADNLARLFAALINPAPKPAVRFPDIAGRTSEVVVPTRHGDVAATVYHPSEEPAGAYVNIHGGGFVVGHREQDDPWCRYLAAHAGVIVINTDYVLAPAHRFPAAPQQIYDVVSWAAREWAAAPICVGGQSAGGSLAAAAARLALENHGPAIALQVLHYAPLDLVTPTRAKRSAIGDKAVMKPWMGQVFDTAYIPDPAQRNDRLASPALDVADLTGIAPALVVTAEYDRLRDEARRYADTLQAAGALAEYYEVPGVDHGYNIMSDAADVTLAAYGHITDHVRRAITSS
jgi:acetyl esterase